MLSSGVERLVNITISAVKEYSLDQLNRTWKLCMKEFLDSRKLVQAEKAECMESLKTSLGHPTMAAELYSLNEIAKKSNQKMLELIDQTREKTLNQFEKVTHDFVARLLFIFLFLGDIGANWNFQTRMNGPSCGF